MLKEQEQLVRDTPNILERCILVKKFNEPFEKDQAELEKGFNERWKDIYG